MPHLWLLELQKKNALRKIHALQKNRKWRSRLPEFLVLFKQQSAEIDRIDFLIESARSNQLISRALALDLEFPPQSEEQLWNEKQFFGIKFQVLSPRGRSVLRSKIDAEKARRFEVRTLWVTKFWLPLLAALVGIIGALTGLVAVLRHTK